MPMTKVMKLDGANYLKLKKTLVINLIFMKLYMALEMNPLQIPNSESIVKAKKLCEDWRHLNMCYTMMMENYMDGFIYASIPKVETINK